VERSADELFERARALGDVHGTDTHMIELLSTYVRFVPDNGRAWYYLGDALRVVGRFKEGEDALLKAVALAPDSVKYTLYARLGMIATKRSSPAEAEKWFRMATATTLCPGWVWTLRGANLLRLEDYALAKTCLETAVASEDVVEEEVFLNLALMARAQRRYAEAREYLQRALAKDASYADAKTVLASLSDIENTVELANSIAIDLASD
jgi:tetratricopeptide (TPR) repeat protein